jgi:tight adherence protein B
VTHLTPRRLAGAAVVLALVALGPVLAAGAADSGSSNALVQLRAVNALNPSSTKATYFDTGTGAGSPPTLTINNASVAAGTPKPLGSATKRCVAIVFDTSDKTSTSSVLVSAKAAVRDWITSRRGDAAVYESFALYNASDTGIQVQPCTNDTASLTSALDQITMNPHKDKQGKTALWSAVNLAASGLSQQSNSEPDLLIVAAQGDNVSGSNKDSAVGAIATAQTTVFGLVYTGGGYSGGDIQSLSDTYGGQTLTTSQGAQIGTLVNQAAATIDHGQFETTFASPGKDNAVNELTLTSHGSTAEGVYTVGTSSYGLVSLNASSNAGKAGVSVLQGGVGLFLGILLVVIAASLLAYGVFLLITRESHLTNVLQPYSEGYVGGGDTGDDEEEGSYAKTAIIQRAVEVTEQFAESQGYLARAEASLERANLPLRAGEALFFYAAIVVIATVLGLAILGFIPGLIIGLLAVIGPIAVVNFLAGRRRKKFLSQLPDTLTLLAGTLRAGYSLMQGVEAISQEVEDPMGQELRRVVTEARLGRPLEESLEGVAERMASPDFAWSVMAIRIQREVGGNLSELLMTVADTMTQRERLRRDIAALTAEGRISALVLACLPIGLAILMYLINPTYMSKLLNDTLGNIMLGLSVLGMVVGFLWMRKIINIEI